MNYAQQNFLQGIASLADTILSDAAGIVRMRIDSANKLAVSKARSMEADYILKLETGKIKPEDFESSFGDYENSLNDMVDTIEFEPAREMARANVTSMLPETKLRYGIAMNKRHMALVEADTLETLDEIANRPGIGATEKLNESLRLINDPTNPFDELWKRTKSREATEHYSTQEMVDFGKKSGYENAIEVLEDDEEVPINIRYAAITQMSKAMEAEDKAAVEEAKAMVQGKMDALSTDPEADLKKFLEGKNISESAREQVRAMFYGSQVDALYAHFYKSFNDNIDDRTRLKQLRGRLMVEGDDTKLGEAENWYGEQGRREELIRKIDARLAYLDPAQGSGSGSGAGSVESTTAWAKAGISQVEQDWKNGTVQKDGKPLSLMQALTMIDGLNLATGGAATAHADSSKDGMLKHVPPLIKTGLEQFSSRLKTDKEFARLPQDTKDTMVRDASEYYESWAKMHPNPTQAESEAFIKGYNELWYSQKLSWMRENSWTAGTGDMSLDSKNVRFGYELQQNKGAADAAVNTGFDGRTSMHGAVEKSFDSFQNWARDTLLSEYGISGTPQWDDSGNLWILSGGVKYRAIFDSATSFRVVDDRGNEVQSNKPRVVPKPASVMPKAAPIDMGTGLPVDAKETKPAPRTPGSSKVTADDIDPITGEIIRKGK